MEGLAAFFVVIALIGMALFSSEHGKDNGICQEKCAYVTEYKRIDDMCYCKVEGEWKKPLECKR